MLQCTFENGNQALLRHLTVHAIVIKNNHILLVKRSAQMTNPHKYAFPGGFVDRDETMAEAALRELKEETGYEGKIISLFSICDNPHRAQEDRQNIAVSFLIEAGEKVGEGDDESSEVKWFELTELPNPSEFAFDHWEHLQLCLRYLTESANVQLPLMLSGSTV